MLGRRLADVGKPMDLDDPSLDPELVERLKSLKLLRREPETPTPQPDTATAIGNAVRSAELTQTLITRLIQQLERGLAAAPSADLTA